MKLIIAILVPVLLISLSNIDVEGLKVLKGSKTYTVPNGFSFKYPSDWKLEERENRFSPIDAVLKYGRFNDVHMTFQGDNKNESFQGDVWQSGKNKNESGLSGSDNELIETMGTMITKNYEDGSLYENDSNKYIINNQTAPYVIGTYTGGWSTDLRTGDTTPIDWAVMLVAVHLNEDQIVLLGYTTKTDDFDRYLPKVEQVFK